MSDDTAIRPDCAFLETVQLRSGESVSRCYQCRKCTNGCPLAFAMDLKPNQIMRAIQLGLEEEILGSTTIWICASCQTCTARCPNDIDIAHLMDTLRQLSQESDVEPADPKIVKFHQALLESVSCHGRLFELGMVGRYKLKTLDFTSGALLGAKMAMKGKLKLLPSRIKGKQEVRRMFKKKKEG